jgi:phosphoglycolate phosphatase-like HAD superfamily hydrolase
MHFAPVWHLTLRTLFVMENDISLVSLQRSYHQLIFDCDGVIVDSNAIKEANIRAAALAVCGPEEADRFVAYFVGNNGVAREPKIATFFADPATRRAVLAIYNRLNAATIPFIGPEPEAKRFLHECARAGMPLYVLSGGDEEEVRKMLGNAGIAELFREIMGGPSSKMEHLDRLGLSGPTCYFGDSQYDYEVAARFGYDFIFFSRYSQFRGWQEFFAQRPSVRVVSDFQSFV